MSGEEGGGRGAHGTTSALRCSDVLLRSSVLCCVTAAVPPLCLLQAVLSAGLKTRESSLALAALGHFHHVRGEAGRAAVFYHRCLHQNPDSAYCLLLSSCLQATEVGRRQALLPSTRTLVQPQQGPLVDRKGGGGMKHALDVAEEDEAIDAQFRRGLFFLQSPNSNRWVGLLAYAEFVACRLQDCKRAEDVHWEAARLSCKYCVWAVIALAHFYQYLWDDLDRARKVMGRGMRRGRRKLAALLYLLQAVCLLLCCSHCCLHMHTHTHTHKISLSHFR